MSNSFKTKNHALALAVDGPISGFEGAHLAHLASRIEPGGLIVELGTNLGKSASFMAFALLECGNDTARVHCVDLWSLGGETQQHNYHDPQGRRHQMFRDNRERLGLTEIVIDHEAESVAFSKSWTEAIDLLFIDAGHSYEAVKADYEAWHDFIKPGGFIAFHDYMDMWPGIKKLIDEEVKPDPQWSEWQIVDRMITARRTK